MYNLTIKEINLAGIVFTAGQVLKLEKTYDVKLESEGTEVSLKIATIDCNEEHTRYRAVYRELSDKQMSALEAIIKGCKGEEVSLKFLESKGEK
jgi:hypothetical protein